MRNIFATTAAVLVLAVAYPSIAEEATGRWTGAIDGHLIALVHIARADDGRLSGTFASHESPLSRPDPTALRSEITAIVATPDRLSFRVPGNGGIFDGRWDETKKAWDGTFQWGEDGYRSTLSLSRTELQSLPEAPKRTTYASPQAETQALDTLVAAYAGEGRFMGAVLVARGGKVLLDKGYGQADMARAIPNTPDTAFRIGSITKQFTAATILMLQEEGKLKIDAPIKDYLPDAPAAWDGVTLRHLLTHTSGLGDYLADLTRQAAPGTPPAFARDMTPTEILAVVRAEPLQFAPGSQFRYSNSGYALLGAVIEKVTGKPYGEALRDMVFRPAGMTATAYNPAPGGKQALGYAASLSGPVPAPPMTLSSVFAGGGIVSTTRDLAKWHSALIAGKVLSPASIREMVTPAKADQGMGVVVLAPYGHPNFRHGGLVSGFRADAQFEPSEGLSIIVLGNLDREGVNTLADGLLAITHGQSGTMPPEAYPVAAATLAGYAGTYVLTPQLSVVIAFEDGQLTAQATGQPKVILYAQSETVFYSRELDRTTLEFVKGEDGGVSVILHAPGGDIPGRRQ